MRTYEEILTQTAIEKHRIQSFVYNEEIDGTGKEAAIQYAKEVLDNFVSKIGKLHNIYFSGAYIDEFKNTLK